jgi:glycosyltransferase involved in cell wall biosynthesis
MGTLLMKESAPKITVLMPLFNGERFVREALESILGQTFTDFEFLIIDDGSTDASVQLVESYDDPRIRLISNHRNLGVTATLNQGINLAQGEYIARMDCDDVSLPTRLAEQVAYLEQHPDCAMVAVKVSMVDEGGKEIGAWLDDKQTPTSEEMYRFLPRGNCIAHPGIMIRKAILSRYRYNEHQRVAQDYDLWLRMAADRLVFAKLAEPLLRYRLNADSVTANSNPGMPDLKNLRTKAFFLWQRIAERKVNGFCFKVFCAAARDLSYAVAKKALDAVGLNLQNRDKSQHAHRPKLDSDLRIMQLNNWAPVRFLVTLGKGIGAVLPVENASSLFFFFPFLHVGGAERVHAEVVSCFAEQKPWVFFTKRSRNSRFRMLFPPQARLFNIWPLLKYGYPLSVGIMAGLVNRHQKPVVFGCNSLFFYLLVPYLKPDVVKIDLLHAFGGKSDQFSLPVVELIDHRVVINGKTRDDLQGQYAEQQLDPRLIDRVVLIENRVSVPQEYPEKLAHEILTVLFVGRGAPEKRVHLFGKAATLCQEREIPARFVLVGDMGESLAARDRQNCLVQGEITDHLLLAKIYREADLIVITSEREGFPLVIMEAMAQGVVPVSTDVGGISLHVRHGENGMLLENGPEEQIVTELVRSIELLCRDRELLKKLSRNAFDYARATFDSETFCRAYKKLLVND